MDPEAGASSQRRAFPRVPLRAKARMEFAEQRCFLSEWAVNLSPGGMFVRSEAPMAAGQRFHFEASLTPKGPCFGGVGEVMWVRHEWEGNARPPGFAVRFLELEEEGRAMMVRLADLFLDHGVGAMQEELQAMSAAWQRRRLDEESTDELRTAEEPQPPLPDTAVLQAPWLLPAGEDEAGEHEPMEPATAEREATPAADGERTVTAPLAVEPAAETPAAATPPPASRRRVWWVGVLALLLGGGYFVTRGQLVVREPQGGRLGNAADRGAAAAVLPAMPVAVPASARPLVRPAVFSGLDDVRCAAEGDGLGVVLLFDGVPPADSLARSHEPDPPREVIRLLGVKRGYAGAVPAVDSPLLEGIRVASHPGVDGAGDELWVVLDLASPAVVVREVPTDGRSLRLLLVRDEAVPAAAPAASTPQ